MKLKAHQSVYAFPNARYWKPKQTAHAETGFVSSSIYCERRGSEKHMTYMHVNKSVALHS